MPAHQDMYLHQLGNLIRIQATIDGQASGPMLAIELGTGSIGLSEASVQLQQELGAKQIFGLIGIQRLIGGSALAIITGVRQVCFSFTYSLATRHALKSAHTIPFSHNPADPSLAQVAVLRGQPVYRVTNSQIIVSEHGHVDDQR